MSSGGEGQVFSIFGTPWNEIDLIEFSKNKLLSGTKIIQCKEIKSIEIQMK